MTTIVYDGETRTLYTDSMVTTRVAGATSRTDMTYKVEDLSRLNIVTKKRERLVAMAFSGAIANFQRTTKFILAHLHHWHEGHQSLADQGATLNELSGSNVMLITSKQLYCFRFGGSRLEIEELELDENVTFGSGGAFAKTAMEVYGASGFDAVAAAAICDPNTGCLIHCHKIVNNKLVTQNPVLYLDSDVERLGMRRRAGRSRLNLHVANLFDKPPENILINIHEDSPFIKEVREKHQTARTLVRALARTKKKESVALTTSSPIPARKTAVKKVRR